MKCWRNGSVTKRPHCSRRRCGFSSQHLHGGSQLPISPVPRTSTFFWLGQKVEFVCKCISTYVQENTQTHIFKKKPLLKWQFKCGSSFPFFPCSSRLLVSQCGKTTQLPHTVATASLPLHKILWEAFPHHSFRCILYRHILPFKRFNCINSAFSYSSAFCCYSAKFGLDFTINENQLLQAYVCFYVPLPKVWRKLLSHEAIYSNRLIARSMAEHIQTLVDWARKTEWCGCVSVSFEQRFFSLKCL